MSSGRKNSLSRSYALMFQPKYTYMFFLSALSLLHISELHHVVDTIKFRRHGYEMPHTQHFVLFFCYITEFFYIHEVFQRAFLKPLRNPAVEAFLSWVSFMSFSWIIWPLGKWVFVYPRTRDLLPILYDNLPALAVSAMGRLVVANTFDIIFPLQVIYWYKLGLVFMYSIALYMFLPPGGINGLRSRTTKPPERSA